MNFETTFPAGEVEAALASLEDASSAGKAAGDAIRSIVGSGAFGLDRLLHVHATFSERMVAVLVRVVERPEDAR